MKSLGAILIVLVSLGLAIGFVGCSKDSTNPTAPTTPSSPYPEAWFPLANGIATVWENVDYDSMGMGGIMYADTSACEPRISTKVAAADTSARKLLSSSHAIRAVLWAGHSSARMECQGTSRCHPLTIAAVRQITSALNQ